MFTTEQYLTTYIAVEKLNSGLKLDHKVTHIIHKRTMNKHVNDRERSVVYFDFWLLPCTYSAIKTVELSRLRSKHPEQ